MAGACMALGLKFAGSANEEAFDCLVRSLRVCCFSKSCINKNLHCCTLAAKEPLCPLSLTQFAVNKKLLAMLSKPLMVIQSGKSVIESCLIVATLSLAMVMAGTGNLDVLRLCRYLRARVGPTYNSYVLYGSHMAISMSLGLLFLGGGR